MRKRRARRNRHSEPELDITAFMNLMVILVPFLLLTAAFTEISVFQLVIPQKADVESLTVSKNEMQLEIIIRENVLLLSNTNKGVFKKIDNVNSQHDINTLSKELTKLKGKYPNKKDVVLLAEEKTPYKILVKIMDAVRANQVAKGNEILSKELFPNISIGDAPEITIASRVPNRGDRS